MIDFSNLISEKIFIRLEDKSVLKMKINFNVKFKVFDVKSLIYSLRTYVSLITSKHAYKIIAEWFVSEFPSIFERTGTYNNRIGTITVDFLEELNKNFNDIFKKVGLNILEVKINSKIIPDKKQKKIKQVKVKKISKPEEKQSNDISEKINNYIKEESAGIELQKVGAQTPQAKLEPEQMTLPAYELPVFKATQEEKEKPIFCSRCGRKLFPDEMYCAKCGKKVDN